MAHDSFYSLTEVFNFAASSQMEFPNSIDIRLDKYTSLPTSQDFTHLLARATTLHQQTTEAIAVLMSSISISESHEAIEQAKRMGRLTFLAFIFVPLSFPTGIFWMNVQELKDDVGVKWWFALSLPVLAGAIAMFYFDFSSPMGRIWNRLIAW